MFRAAYGSVTRFVKHEDGVTAMEYAVIVALVVVIAIGGIVLLGQGASTDIDTVQQNLPSN